METLIGIVISLVAGFSGGGAIVYFMLTIQRNNVTSLAKTVESDRAQLVELEQRLNADRKQIAILDDGLRKQRAELEAKERTFNARHVSYSELQAENELCKRDLRNIEMTIRKNRLDE